MVDPASLSPSSPTNPTVTNLSCPSSCTCPRFFEGPSPWRDRNRPLSGAHPHSAANWRAAHVSRVRPPRPPGKAPHHTRFFFPHLRRYKARKTARKTARRSAVTDPPHTDIEPSDTHLTMMHMVPVARMLQTCSANSSAFMEVYLGREGCMKAYTPGSGEGGSRRTLRSR